MTRLIALVLLFAVPAFAQQQTSLVPAYEQPNEPVVPLKAEASADWKPWVVVGGAVLTVAAVVTVLAFSFANRGSTLQRRDFPCAATGAMACDGFVNPPPP